MPIVKPRRILIAYSMMSTYVPTTLEYLLALKNFTNYEVDYVHVTHGAWLNFDINEYDVVFHNYCARLCFDGYVSQHYEKALMNFRGPQDSCAAGRLRSYRDAAPCHSSIRVPCAA